MELEAIAQLEAVANKQGATIYNICHRNAGWGIQWHENNRQADSPEWRDGLVIYRYYESLAECVQGELSRIGTTQPTPKEG